jgi:hypothetical protein
MGIFTLFRQVKWARRIAVGLFVLLFLAVVLGVLILFNLNRVVKAGIERGGGIVLGVPVTVEDVDVSLFSGRAELTNLVMGSPEGYESEQMLKLERCYLEMKFRSLLSDEIVIDTVELEKPDIMYEFGGEHGSNWKTLMARLQRADEEEAKRPVRIGKVVVNGTRVRVSGGGILTNNWLVRNRALPLPRLEVSEFSTGADNTLTIAEALTSLLRNLVRAISEKIGLGGAGGTTDDTAEDMMPDQPLENN